MSLKISIGPNGLLLNDFCLQTNETCVKILCIKRVQNDILYSLGLSSTYWHFCCCSSYILWHYTHPLKDTKTLIFIFLSSLPSIALVLHIERVFQSWSLTQVVDTGCYVASSSLWIIDYDVFALIRCGVVRVTLLESTAIIDLDTWKYNLFYCLMGRKELPNSGKKKMPNITFSCLTVLN